MRRLTMNGHEYAQRQYGPESPADWLEHGFLRARIAQLKHTRSLSVSIHARVAKSRFGERSCSRFPVEAPRLFARELRRPQADGYNVCR